jgi:heat shock protein HtpX
MVTVVVCEIVFGILASIIVAAFSRHREYRADAGAAKLMARRADGGGAAPPGRPGRRRPAAEHAGDGHLGRQVVAGAVASHPPIESRIAALQGTR